MELPRNHHLAVRSLLATAGAAFSSVDYSPRATIFRQGDAAESTLYLESGRVWLAVTGRAGSEGICGLLDEGDSSATKD